MRVALAILVAGSRRKLRGKTLDSVVAGVPPRFRDARVYGAVGKSGDNSLTGRNISRLSDYLIAVRLMLNSVCFSTASGLTALRFLLRATSCFWR